MILVQFYFLISLGSLLSPLPESLSLDHPFPSFPPLLVQPIESHLFQDPHLRLIDFRTPPQQVSIEDLLANAQTYHQHLISIQGLITQPELHLDETELFLNFVFRLSQGNDSIVVYGKHDRTRGAPPISLNHSVEVIGIFWKEQDRNGATIINAIEAISVTPYPSSIPENA